MAEELRATEQEQVAVAPAEEAHENVPASDGADAEPGAAEALAEVQAGEDAAPVAPASKEEAEGNESGDAAVAIATEPAACEQVAAEAPGEADAAMGDGDGEAVPGQESAAVPAAAEDVPMAAAEEQREEAPAAADTDAHMEAPPAAQPETLASQATRPALPAATQPAAAAKAPAGKAGKAKAGQAKAAAAKEVKRPKTAYQLFSVENRARMGEEIGAVKITAIQVALAKRWNEMGEAERARYQEEAKELKAQYEKALAAGAVPAASTRARRASPKQVARKAAMLRNLRRRAEAGVKKPQTSYSLWLMESRQEILGQLAAEGIAKPSFAQMARAASTAWKALPQEAKVPFVERSRALSSKYKVVSKAQQDYKSMGAKVAGAKKSKAAAPAKKQAEAKKPPAKGETKKAGVENLKKAIKAGATPTKAPRKAPTASSRTPPKRARRAPAAEPEAPYLDVGLAAEVEKAGLVSTFQRLAGREDMRKFSQRTLLDALLANGGLLHRTKDALLAGEA